MSIEFGQGPTLVLGTRDHEMEAIVRMCRRTATPYVFATGPEGQRVSYKEAYSASGVSNLDLVEQLGGTIIPVECHIPSLEDRCVGTYDHHRPKDFGYNGEPHQAWELSSFGQYVNDPRFSQRALPHLRDEDRAVGAIDDNPRAAMQGIVPLVSPELAFEVLLTGIGNDHKLSETCVRSRFNIGESAYNNLPTMRGWGGKVHDARQSLPYVPVYNDLDRLLLLAHAYKTGTGVISHCIERPVAKTDVNPKVELKVTINGATPESVKNFITWGKEMQAEGANHLYYNDRRGYGGFYVDPDSDYTARYVLNSPANTHYNLQVV